MAGVPVTNKVSLLDRTDSIVVLNNGKITHQGSIEDLKASNSEIPFLEEYSQSIIIILVDYYYS